MADQATYRAATRRSSLNDCVLGGCPKREIRSNGVSVAFELFEKQIETDHLFSVVKTNQKSED